jgi:hypothetical protein
MTISRRKMREASRSLAVAFNVGRVQEALYRIDAGELPEDDDKLILRRLADFFTDARAGFEWTQETVGGTTGEFDLDVSPSLRSLRLVLPVIRGYPIEPVKTLENLRDVALQLSEGKAVDPGQRQTFETVLGDLASLAGNKLNEALEQQARTVRLSPLQD